MHNKSFTVDGHASIVGGRNIADEYFELKTDAEFRDFDMLAVGPITDEVSAKVRSFLESRAVCAGSAPWSMKAIVRDLKEARANFRRKSTC